MERPWPKRNGEVVGGGAHRVGRIRLPDVLSRPAGPQGAQTETPAARRRGTHSRRLEHAEQSLVLPGEQRARLAETRELLLAKRRLHRIDLGR